MLHIFMLIETDQKSVFINGSGKPEKKILHTLILSSLSIKSTYATTLFHPILLSELHFHYRADNPPTFNDLKP